MAKAWWDWSRPEEEWENGRLQFPEDASMEEKGHELKRIVARSVLLDNMSPSVDQSVLTAALGQFGGVQSVKFLKNPNDMKSIGCAIVEMEKPKAAAAVVEELRDYLFMLGGMPRPVCAKMATEAMFLDHPLRIRKRPICVKFVDMKDPDGPYLFKRRNLARKHAEQVAYLVKLQKSSEEDLDRKHERFAMDVHKKYKLIAENKGFVNQLKRAYGLPVK